MPSTLGIIASHNRYIPPTYAITTTTLSSAPGKSVTWNVNTSLTSGTLYYTLFSQTNAATTADFTDNLASGSILITNGVGSLTKTFKSTTEEVYNYATVELRTGSTSGPIVATAPMVTRFVPIYSGSASYNSGTITYPAYSAVTTQILTAQPDWNGGFFKIYWNLLGNVTLMSLDIMTGNTVTQNLYSYNSPDRSITAYGRLFSTNSLRFTTGYRTYSASKSYQILLYPQTNPEVSYLL